MPSTPITRRTAVAALATSLAAGTSPWRSSHAASPTAATPRHPGLERISERFYTGNFEMFPLDATENAGDPAYEGRFEIEIAPAHRRRQRRFYEGILRSLRGVPVASLSPSDRITWDLLDYEVRDRLARLDIPFHLMPVGHMESVPVRIARWASGKDSQPLKTAQNYRNFHARLAKLPAWIDQAIANMRQGIASGVVLPRPLIERTLPLIEGLVPAQGPSPFLAGVQEFPAGIAASEQARLRSLYENTVRASVVPAVRKLAGFMRSEYLAAGRATSGLGAFAGGNEWYRVSVRSSTTTDMTPQQIHELGLKEVARIRADMEAIKQKFGYAGELNAFLVSLDDRPELMPFRQEAEVLAAYVALDEKVKAQLPQLFERAPKAPIAVRAVEPARRDTASDYYVPPATDGSRPGAFYAVIRDPLKYKTTRMVALFLHEGQPGHHYQIALQQELDLPRFRKTGWYDAFGEGWALYAESLGRELGLYDDPNAYLGRLLMELHRALRLVVDTGMHALGWSREQAIAFLREKEGTTEQSARSAIERYMAWPAQALSYKVGELKILELRERARSRLGARFDIRKFHTQVLAEGCLPLRMLEARIDAWIAAGGA